MINNQNSIVLGNIHKIDEVQKKTKDNYMVLLSTKEGVNEKDNTIYFDKAELARKEQVSILKNNVLSVHSYKYSVKDIDINDYLGIQDYELEIEYTDDYPDIIIEKQKKMA